MCLKCEKTQKMVLLSQKVSLSTRSITCMMNAPVNHQRSGGGKYEKQKYEKIHAKSSIRSQRGSNGDYAGSSGSVNAGIAADGKLQTV